MSKICIVVVNSADCNRFRLDPPSIYIPKAKKTEEERTSEVKSQMADGGWPRDEGEEVNLTDFNRIVKKIGKRDEFSAGYLTIPDDIGKPFYNNPDVQKIFAKHNPRVINKFEYLQIIEIMRKMIVDNYYDVLHDKQNWQGVLETKMEMWEYPHDFPYNLDSHTKNITNVYTAEIQIWDLIRMYKNIDWMRDTVIIYGW